MVGSSRVFLPLARDPVRRRSGVARATPGRGASDPATDWVGCLLRRGRCSGRQRRCRPNFSGPTNIMRFCSKTPYRAELGSTLHTAEAAGLSRRQAVTATRVASVPEDDFEAQVESDIRGSGAASSRRPATREATDTPPIKAPQALTLSIETRADVERYDALRKGNLTREHVQRSRLGLIS
jgi:hypothetical protein